MLNKGLWWRRTSLGLALGCVGIGGCGPGPIRPVAVPPGDDGAPWVAGPEEIQIRRMLIAYQGAEGAAEDVERSEEEARERAFMLAGLARERGTSFQELASEYGDVHPEGDDRSRVSLLRRDDTDWAPEIIEAAFALGPREVGAPIETPEGFNIIRREASADALRDQVRVRHILLTFSGVEGARTDRSIEAARELATAIVQELRENPLAWARLHQEHSESGTASDDGSIRGFSRNEVEPDFGEAAFGLAIDEVSEPVRSRRGFHIIQRTR